MKIKAQIKDLTREQMEKVCEMVGKDCYCECPIAYSYDLYDGQGGFGVVCPMKMLDMWVEIENNNISYGADSYYDRLKHEEK